MLVPHAAEHTAANDVVPKILEFLANALAGLVGLAFALYLVVGGACVLLAYARRAVGRPGFPSKDFPGAAE